MFKFLKKNQKSHTTVMPAKTAPGYIGLEIGKHSIHLCQLKSMPNKCFSIMAKSSIRFSENRQDLMAEPLRLKRMINNAIKSKPFRGRKVVALMPWWEVKIILLNYRSNVADVDAEIVKLVAKRVDGDIEDYVIDYMPVRCNPTDEEHMAAVSVASKDKVMAMLNTLDQCGLDVESLDIAPAALRRLVGTLYTKGGTDNVLIINAGTDESFLTIVSGRRLLYYQAVSFGENRLLRTIAEELDIEPGAARKLIENNGFGVSVEPVASFGSRADIATTLTEILKPCFLELIEEINRVLIFTASETHGTPLSRVCLLGSIAHWDGAESLLMSLMNVKIETDSTDFWRVFQDENEHTTISWSSLFPELAIATGLALRGMVDHE
ncbi:MAG: pilus assembly protein PilM [Gammaproteobacteria bacterium]|nr:pilus assembly protein PilM [Gammaproteobacteria bacterium]